MNQKNSEFDIGKNINMLLVENEKIIKKREIETEKSSVTLLIYAT